MEPSDETSTTILSATSSNITTANNKKGRKKKECPRPIKVERFSDIDTQSPISSRTRKGSLGREKPQQEDKPRNGSIYEDATDQMPINSVNETVNLGEAMNSNATMNFGAAPADATYCTAAQTTFQVAPAQTTFVMDNPNATVTISQKSNNEGDATFNVAANKNGKNSNGTQRSLSSTRNTMETAKDSSPNQNDSLITEDESFEKRQTAIKKNLPKIPTSAKAYQMPMRTKELFK